MVNILVLIIVTLVVTVIGGGFGWLIWIKTRPKKETWTAKVYQLGRGIREPISHEGKVISNLKLQDLQPYASDILEKLEKSDGTVIYRLKKLNKTTPAVESDVVEFWGKDQKYVSVLLTKSGCTLLQKGYDKDAGEIIFDPLPHSRINLIKGEVALRKDRLQKEKDILQAITPWVVAGITILGLVAICYIMISGYVTMSENLKEATESWGDMLGVKQAQDNLKEELRQGIVPEPHELGSQNKS